MRRNFMREIIRERLIEERDILLFDILEELKKLTKPKKEEKPEVEEKPEKEEKIKTFKCKYCGELHEKSWQIGLCAKKNKKG